MSIYERIAINIKYYAGKLESTSKFQKYYPNKSIYDYLSNESGISVRRIKNIIECKVKIKIPELCILSEVLGIEIEKLFDRREK